MRTWSEHELDEIPSGPIPVLGKEVGGVWTATHSLSELEWGRYEYLNSLCLMLTTSLNRLSDRELQKLHQRGLPIQQLAGISEILSIPPLMGGISEFLSWDFTLRFLMDFDHDYQQARGGWLC